jgi:hypothetical protein
MAYIDTKYLGKCETCRNLRGGKCNTYCDHGEEYSPNLSKIPIADVEEVRHGEWEQNPYCKRIYFCSECGRHIEDGSCNPYEHFPYCHCGAKMDGGKKE